MILSKLYTNEGIFTFTSHSPGEHLICLYSNTTAWFSGAQLRVHLDIQVGEHAQDYQQVFLYLLGFPSSLQGGLSFSVCGYSVLYRVFVRFLLNFYGKRSSVRPSVPFLYFRLFLASIGILEFQDIVKLTRGLTQFSKKNWVSPRVLGPSIFPFSHFGGFVSFWEVRPRKIRPFL